MNIPIVFWPKSIQNLMTADLRELENGQVVVELGDNRILSVQPDGSFQTRSSEAVGPWERGTRIGDSLLLFMVETQPHYVVIQEFVVNRSEPPPPPPPPPPLPPEPRNTVFDVPMTNVDFNNPNHLVAFIKWARLQAYGFVDNQDVQYWVDGKAQECLERGEELNMKPPSRYLYERLIGRGAGAPWIAKYGPYAGKSECQESLTPWHA